jgi:rubrerythrin
MADYFVCEDCRRTTSGRCSRHSSFTIPVLPPPSDALPREVLRKLQLLCGHDSEQADSLAMCPTCRMVADAAFRLGLAQQAGEIARLREALATAGKIHTCPICGPECSC